MKENNEEYSPVDICTWFNIPRTTLFRWEQMNEIPTAERGNRERRIYRRHHLNRIVQLMRSKWEDEYRAAIKHDPQGAYPTLEMQERLYRLEFFGDKNPQDGLQQLRGLAVRKALSPQTVEALANRALKSPPDDTLRAKIWKVLAINDQSAV